MTDGLDEFEIALVDSSRERPGVPERKNPIGSPVDDCPVDTRTSENLPAVTTATDNGGPFRSFRFEAFIAATRNCSTSARRSAGRSRTGHANEGSGP